MVWSSFCSFCFTLLYLQCHVFSELFLTSIIMLLTPVSSCYMKSFNDSDKKARDVDLTFGCHVSNIMLESIFYDSMGWKMTCFFVFLRGSYCCLPQHRRNGFSLITITPLDVGNLNPQRTKTDGFNYLSVKFQFQSISEDSRVGISLRGFSYQVFSFKPGMLWFYSIQLTW